eukprot:11914065-Prorocentrum_lima.AAC.1
MGKSVQKGHRVIFDRESDAGAAVVCLDYGELATDGEVRAASLGKEGGEQDGPSEGWNKVLFGAHAGTGFPLA